MSKGAVVAGPRDASEPLSPPRRSPSLRGRLVLCAAGIVLPLMLFYGAVSVVSYQAERGRTEERVLQTARAMAQAVDLELQARVLALQALASATSLQSGDLQGFQVRAEAFLTLLSGATLGLTDREGRVLLIAGPGLPPLPAGAIRASPAAAEQVFGTGQPVVSDLFTGSLTRKMGFSVSVPVFRDGQVAYALSLNPYTEGMARIIARQNLPAGWVASVFDSAGVNVARVPNGERFVGQPASPTLRPRLLAEPSGTMENLSLEGTPLLSAWSRTGAWGWSVGIGVPRAELLAPLWRSLAWTAGAGAAALALSALLASMLSRRVLQPVQGLMELASHPDTPAPATLGLHEADVAANALRAALAARAAASRELRTIFDTAPIGVVRATRAGGIQDANPAYLALIGATEADLRQGRVRWDRITPPEWLAADEKAIADTAAGGPCAPYEKEYVRPDGQRVPVLVTFTVLDADAGLLAGFAVDLTRLKLAERRLALQLQIEAQLRGLADPHAIQATACEMLGRHLGVSQVGYVTIEPGGATAVRAAWSDGRTRSFAGSLQLDGYGAEVARDLRRGMAVTVANVQADPRTSSPAVAEAYAAHSAAAFVSTPLVKPGGLVASLYAVSATPRDWSEADVALVRDVAERTWAAVQRAEAEAALRHLNETLEAQVRHEVAAREVAQERLAQAQRMEALGKLAGGIAHDFNNVLQAVQGGLSLIGRRAGDAEVVRQLARMAEDAAARGAAITGRLLAFARKGELRAQPVAAAPVLASLREMLAATLGPGVETRIEAGEDVPPLLADKAQLETALVNLAVNARDAMPDGGTLTVSAAAEAVPALHHAVLAPGEYVRLDVADTGAGMDAATLARASEPFFTTKPVGQGTGLGLAMARGFAQQSGGGFAIRSAPGQGTTVSLWFPCAAAGVAADAAPDAPDALAPGQAPRVLVVDDDAMVRTVLVEQLQDLHYHVTEAADGLAALAALEAGTAVDVLVTDFSMPGMNGAVLIGEARRRRPPLPAVLLTGYADAGLEAALEQSHGAGTVLLRKPVTGRGLAEGVASVLRGRLMS